MSVHVIDLGRTFPRDICEDKPIAQTCEKCGAPLRNNKCEYCGTVYGPVAELTKKEEENNDLFNVTDMC